MSTEPTASEAAERGAPVAVEARGLSMILTVAAVVALACAGAVIHTQITVTDGALDVTRTCGSAFDSMVDRTGWETWWARDLDEIDGTVRAGLVRTELCPAAVNRHIAMAAGFMCLAGVLLFGAAWRRRRVSRDDAISGVRTDGRRIVLLGRATSWVGVVLSIAGMVAIIVLVADADSTLFLYTDRLVVGVVGLLVLMPTLALAALGRMMVLVGEHVESVESDG